MNEILKWMKLDPATITAGQRHSIGSVLATLGVRKHKTNVAWLYIF
jgi:ATP-dependent protease ClpP protease subunit